MVTVFVQSTLFYFFDHFSLFFLLLYPFLNPDPFLSLHFLIKSSFETFFLSFFVYQKKAFSYILDELSLANLWCLEINCLHWDYVSFDPFHLLSWNLFACVNFCLRKMPAVHWSLRFILITRDLNVALVSHHRCFRNHYYQALKAFLQLTI
jgi:hypothetical protein